MNALPTLEEIEIAFDGTIDRVHGRVLATIRLGERSNVAVQIIQDAAAPDGIRVHCPDPKRLDAATDFVRIRLKLPPLYRHANDNKSPNRQTGFTAAELQHMVFPPIKYIVQGYLAEGCTLFAGRPKIGKSWLALDIGLAVSRGSTCLGDIQCEAGSVLFLALEDNPRRLHDRAKKLMPYTFPAMSWPANLHLHTEWPRADAGGLTKIDEWLDAHPDARLVVVDVLAMFRPLNTNKNAYEQDYLAIKSLQDIASRRNIAVLILTHTRKAASESGDPFEMVSGTLGLSGAADATLILDRDSQGANLYSPGRDVEEIESAVVFDKLTCKWRVLGDVTEVRRSDERAKILTFLTDADEPLAPGKIAVGTGMPRNNVDRLLGKMMKAAEVEKVGRGRYIHPDRTDLRDSNPTPGKKGKKVRKDDEVKDSDAGAA